MNNQSKEITATTVSELDSNSMTITYDGDGKYKLYIGGEECFYTPDGLNFDRSIKRDHSYLKNWKR